VLAIAASLGCFYLVRSMVDTWNMTNLPGAPDTSAVNQAPTSPATSGTPDATMAVTPVPLMPDPTAVPWDGASRVNILVMGLDYRDWSDNPNAPSRTDSMIVLTIDPLSKTAGMLSIPRDMWVYIPGFDYGPINTAYFLGDAFKVPGGGPGVAVATVEEFLGVPIQYYAQIDFAAFAKFVDELGGVDIIVHETMHISLVGKPEMFELKPGLQTLDGPTLLAYARARHDDEGTLTDDYARAQRQQEVIMAMRDQILQFNMLPILIAKAPALFQDLSSGIRTNMQLDQILKLALLAQSIDKSHIKRGLINVTDVIQTTTVLDGLPHSALVPIPEKIRVIRDEVFTTNSAIKPGAAGGDAATLLRNEKSRVSIQNGAGEPKLATRTAEYFKAQGLNVVEQTSANQPQSTSSLYIYVGKPYTIKYLSSLLKIPESQIYNKFNPDSAVDIEIVLGNDWARKNPMP
jgi:LCP family protein required for cell wall assembly